MLILSKFDHISSKSRQTNIISSYISSSTRHCLVCSYNFSQPEYVWQVIRPISIYMRILNDFLSIYILGNEKELNITRK